ncbi:hypothetical protein J4408_01315 [Candidatus Pacearchaeota archaeon]|nr:hypothetical protein [Candidatus Pacearchaeota archaeon]
MSGRNQLRELDGEDDDNISCLEKDLTTFLNRTKKPYDEKLVKEVVRSTYEILPECFGVNEDEVKGEACLSKDLGAESIDYLDMAFRLERKLKIKIYTETFNPGIGEERPGYRRTQEKMNNKRGKVSPYDYVDDESYLYSENQMKLIHTYFCEFLNAMQEEDKKKFLATRKPIDFMDGQNVLGLLGYIYRITQEQRA